MRSARTSRRQVAGDQRHSRSVQSSTRRTASGAALGSPQSRRSRSQPKPFRASSHSAGAPARCHGGSSDSGATAPALPRARSSPSEQALAGRLNRPARCRAPRRRSCAACRSPGSGNRGGRPAASGRICRPRRRPWRAGWARSGWAGRRPSRAHRTVACLRQRASSFLFFWSDGRIHRPVEGWRSLPDPNRHGDAPARPQYGPAPSLHSPFRPERHP